MACVIIKYLKVTKTLQGSEQNLLIKTKKPHKGVGAQTLGRWIKKTLQKSGIDTTIFKAHSVRHASTSAAFKKGIDLNIIRKTAGWTKTSQVFAKVYNRPTVDKENIYADTILKYK